MHPKCPYCGEAITSHEECCRVPHELDRFHRVYTRLRQAQRNPYLCESLERHLVAFGRGLELRAG